MCRFQCRSWSPVAALQGGNTSRTFYRGCRVTIIIVPFGIIFLIIGFFTYQANLKAARELEHRRIQNRLAQIQREKASALDGEAPEPPARTRRVRSRR